MNYLVRQRFRLHAAVARLRGLRVTGRPAELAGLTFRNPIGVAAGLDRHGRLLASLDALGFGFVEVGTVNDHRDAPLTARRLARWRRQRRGDPPLRIGASIGSLRSALDAEAIDECTRLVRMFVPMADYLVFNLSRPRSPMRTGHFGPGQLAAALQRIRAARLEHPVDRLPPLLVKLAICPDQVPGYPPTVMQLIENSCDGLVMAFEGWPSVAAAADWLANHTPQRPVIAVGGIQHDADIDRYLAAGAVFAGLHRAVQDGIFPQRYENTGGLRLHRPQQP